MGDDVCIGPNGGCPICYHRPCICSETPKERLARQNAERKRRISVGVFVETLDCQFCGESAVVPDRVVRAFVCMKCGKQQKPTWSSDD